MRQTELGLAELKNELQKPDSIHPPCMIVNEIGEIAYGLNCFEEAREELLHLLTDERDNVRYVSFCWLVTISKDPNSPPLSPVITKALLPDFEARTENKKLIRVAKERGIIQ